MTSDDDQPIDRCVCLNVTFERLHAHARAQPACDVDSLRREFGCGGRCGLCVPYLQAMLRTGRTRFAVNDDAINGLPTRDDREPV